MENEYDWLYADEEGNLPCLNDEQDGQDELADYEQELEELGI